MAKKFKLLKRFGSAALALTMLPISAAAQAAGSSELTWKPIPNILLDFEDSSTFYNKNSAANWSASNNRGSHAELVTEANGNKAARLTYDTDYSNENYNANAVMSIRNPETNTKFQGEAKVEYTITFDYKVEETDGKELQLFVTPSNKASYGYTDMGPKAIMGDYNDHSDYFISASPVITEKSDEWVTASVKYTGYADFNNNAVYPIILLQTNNKTKDSTHTGNRPYASVLIDNITVTYPAESFIDNFENSTASSYYTNSRAGNCSSGNTSHRASHTEITADESDNHAIRLTYDNHNRNYQDNPVMTLRNPDTNTKFYGEAGVEYTITFDYKVEETDGQQLQLFVTPTNKTDFFDTDMGPLAVISGKNTPFTNPASLVITQKTDGWVTASVTYTAQASCCPVILLQTNNKTADTTHTDGRPYASVLIDNVSVSEKLKLRAAITCHNYDGGDKELYIYEDTTFSNLSIPVRNGYCFSGWYTRHSELSHKADGNELISKYNCIYAKWIGAENAMTPEKITKSDIVTVSREINIENTDLSGLNSLTCRRDSTLELPGTTTKTKGNYTFSASEVSAENQNTFLINNPGLTVPAGGTFMLYVELPEKNGSDYSLGLTGLSITQSGSELTLKPGGSNIIYYSSEGKWEKTSADENGRLCGLPSSYKGYLLFSPSDLSFSGDSFLSSASYSINSLGFSLNAVGGENGDAVIGCGIYGYSDFPETTVMKLSGRYYELSVHNSSADVIPYSAADEGAAFSTRYSGTSGKAAVKLISAESSAPWSNSPVGISTVSGKQEITRGYMTTYINSGIYMLMQPGTDEFMLYVEAPEFTKSEENAPLKLLDTVITQGSSTATLNFFNSVYKFMDTRNGKWITARAGADGELNDIPSGFKGFIKFDIKQFKNFSGISNIDFSVPYYITKFELGFNYIDSESNPLVIGAVYSVISDSDNEFITNGLTDEKLCVKAVAGDFNCDGTYDTDELVKIRKELLGAEQELDSAAELRTEGIDIRTLVRAKKVCAGAASAASSLSPFKANSYTEIFTDDITSDNTPKIYGRVAVSEPAATIDTTALADYEGISKEFSDEIANSKVGDFEKVGIDKMCHVSTFIYAGGNIYVTYYANTISSAENPEYQVARLAYSPENNTDAKVILDIMQVGDSLYGHKVWGVYDTILMQKENDPDNLYILWTANIDGKYYRLYRIFNMKTETLGEVGVNRFKVGSITNDFSSTGITNALTANNIGYKELFSDIGIMQKLSSRVENGETYYYSGAYSGNFTCIIKSKDLITWEYVAQPNEGANGTGFENETKWENAVYVLNDKVYYFVRQWDYALDSTTNEYTGSKYGILTCYDLKTGEWAKPVLVTDCQSRSDFIVYNNELYLFYAPKDRNHIGILKINTDNIAESTPVLTANMQNSCFYPFIQYNSNGELCMSYTVNRKNIRLASFTLSKYLTTAE